MSLLILLFLVLVVGVGLAALGTGLVVMSKKSGGQKDSYRLAVLLVTEIRLYNEELLHKAREEKAIYRLLGDEIDRSRRIFEQRLPPNAPPESHVHFDEAVLRILANDDPKLLGER